MLFGPSSLEEGDGKTSGPKPKGTRWGIREVTPGAIAFAAILVSVYFVVMFFVHTYQTPPTGSVFCVPR